MSKRARKTNPAPFVKAVARYLMASDRRARNAARYGIVAAMVDQLVPIVMLEASKTPPNQS